LENIALCFSEWNHWTAEKQLGQTRHVIFAVLKIDIPE
jgi:hypothetical protein